MIKKVLGVLLSILILSSSVALTAFAEDNAPAGGNPATNDEAKAFNVETYDYKSLLKTEKAEYICTISETEEDCFALVYATDFPVLMGLEYTDIGDYTFVSAISKPDALGLYVVWFSTVLGENLSVNKTGEWKVAYKDTLKNAEKENFVNMRKVYHSITKAQEEKGYLGFSVKHKDGELGEKIAAAVEKDFGTSDYQEILGEIGENKYLVYCANKTVATANYEEVLGLNLFANGNQVHTYPLGLYVIDGDKAYSLKEAYDDEVINGDEFGKIVKLAIECKYINYAQLKVKANPVNVTCKTKPVKASRLKKAKVTVKPLTIKNAKGTIKVTKVKKGTSAKIYKKIKVNSKNGAITLAKGKYAKKNYKIKLKIYVSGNKNYLPKTIIKTVKVKVKVK